MRKPREIKGGKREIDLVFAALVLLSLLVRFFRSSTLTESLAQGTVNLKQKSRIPHCNLTRIDCKIET